MKKIILVEDMEKFDEESWKKMEKGIVQKGIVMTPDTFSKIFTPERIRLLQRLHKNKIKNTYQLAKELQKPYEVVFRNIKYFEGYGLIKYDRKDKKKIPHLAHELKIEMFPKGEA